MFFCHLCGRPLMYYPVNYPVFFGQLPGKIENSIFYDGQRVYCWIKKNYSLFQQLKSLLQIQNSLEGKLKSSSLITAALVFPFPCNQGTKIGIPKVFRRIPKNSSTNICGVSRNSDSYPPNTLAIRDYFRRLFIHFYSISLVTKFIWDF
jgi:hypothetical protein